MNVCCVTGRHNRAKMEAKAKEEFHYFISSSTAHGLNRIFDAKHAVLRRCLWAVCVVTAVTVLVLMMYGSYLDISSLPFKTVSTVKMTSPLPFPAVTICNMNPLDTTKLTPFQLKAYNSYFETGAGSTPGSDGDGNLTVESTIVAGLIPDHISSPLFNTTEKASPLNGDLFESARIEVGEFFTSCGYGSDKERDKVDCSAIFSPITLTFDR
ncbi:hypothetical protein V1264_004854 [Littorina saxatilis]|uniref:Uncharacterized protein n=1 Tax=Littorina saxatilis TaxID=31220 RepID=A0AAN9G7B7_9CAEN